MKSLFIPTIFSLSLLQCCISTPSYFLYSYPKSEPTKLFDVDDGAKLYLASNDKAVALNKITLSTNGQTTTLDKLLNNYDDNGYLKGWPVNKDLTISTTNTENVTDSLHGFMFISTAEMATDPNFLVYLVTDQKKTIDRSANNETTLVLLNLRVDKSANDPDYKPYYKSRVENIVQPNGTQIYFYFGTPSDGYTDPTYQETVQTMIFRNPISMFPIGNNYFFDNIEPVQSRFIAWYIRALGGGIKMDVSQNWIDESTYQTTKETTTGFRMMPAYSYNNTINFKYTPNQIGMFGIMATTQLTSDVNITMCNNIDCEVVEFTSKYQVFADYFQWNRNDTVLYVEPSDIHSGSLFFQYFRIEGKEGPVPPPLPSSSTPESLETTTKGSPSKYLNVLFIIVSIIVLSIFQT